MQSFATNPLVSILMPFRDTGRFLPECLHSILEQDLKDWELLAVDDHSTDTGREFMEKLAALDARVRVMDAEGRGIIPALRQAYRLSRGQLITRMDSDDLMAPHRLQLMAGQLTSHGPGHLALGRVRYFSHRGISNGYARYEAWINGLTARGENFSEIYKECVIPSPCWMAYRRDLDACGAFNPDRYPEDYDLCFRFYEGGLKCLPSEHLLHYWRDYDQRTSRTSPHYAQNYFLDLKLYHFLRLDRVPGRPLVVWGAGFKGKTIARKLKAARQPFHWLCDNPRKIGRKIYGVPLQHYTFLGQLENAQSIITVANEEAQEAIRNHLHALGQLSMRDFYFFC
ncbi:glycosyltransferase [Robiginitalea marina]|uniref:Glycosyltransferase n=1 Tax=Robiginitalea marina TaxID=2954105 RepID=A0ABT1AUB7_9FLAO|nr:glycosyltransferase [Robiginitalea marina]MCO5723619.1 glycosyltransferase [Robiginitalea marina]